MRRLAKIAEFSIDRLETVINAHDKYISCLALRFPRKEMTSRFTVIRRTYS